MSSTTKQHLKKVPATLAILIFGMLIYGYLDTLFKTAKVHSKEVDQREETFQESYSNTPDMPGYESPIRWSESKNEEPEIKEDKSWPPCCINYDSEGRSNTMRKKKIGLRKD